MKNDLLIAKIEAAVNDVSENFIEYISETVISEDGNEVTIPALRDDDYTVNSEQFLEDADGLHSIKVNLKKGVITTKYSYFQIILPADGSENLVTYRKASLTLEQDDLIAKIVYERLPIIYAAHSNGMYEKHSFHPENYVAIEIKHKDLSQKNDDIDDSIVDAYLFEIADSTGIVFLKSTFINFGEYPEWIDDESDFSEVKLRPLEKSTDGIKLFLSAIQIEDNELRLFSLYKVFEYYSANVLSLDLLENLQKKLDNPKALKADAEFIKSIVDIVRNSETRRNDKELIKLVFVKCIDILDINELIPESIRKSLTYRTKQPEIEKYANDIAETLVATRNKIAHAKSNYELTGKECSPEDIAQFSIFIQTAASRVIRWFNRLPLHQRVNI